MHVDFWYHNSQANFFGEIDEKAIPTHTLNIPDAEFVIGLDENDEEIIEKKPDTRDLFPSVDRKRVTGHRYKPYQLGSKLWRNAANQALSSIAQSNFRRLYPLKGE